MTPEYQRQLDYIFNRPTDEPDWYRRDSSEEEAVFDATPLSAFTFLETLCLNPEEDLKPYSDAQIGLGFCFIFDNGCSDITHDFKAADVPFDRKIKAIHNLFALFRDVLNSRCAAIESAFSQATLSKLNYICYMFWDITPLSSAYGLSFTRPQKKHQNAKEIYENSKLDNRFYYTAIAEVMKNCLDLSNPACVESGIHGLGHLAFSHADIAVPILDNYISKGKNRSESLVNYAKSARTGMIP
jgi:hypothetical protein